MTDSESRGNPFEGVTDFFTELGRIREVGVRGRDADIEPRERTHASAWVPVTDIFVQDEDLVILVELAGVDPEDIDLGFAHGVLTVSGSRRTELPAASEVSYYVRERYYGEFRRAITLPEGTTPDQITAQFDDGLVEVTVRGAVGAGGRTRIELQGGKEGPTTRTLA